MTLIYKILPRAAWEAATTAGRYDGSPADLADGYMHFSTAAQAPETAAKHFAGRGDLMVLAVPTEALGAALKWEPSRGGALFPHLYAPLDCGVVAWVRPAPFTAGGVHDLGVLT